MKRGDSSSKAQRPARIAEDKLPLGSGEFELNFSRARALSLFDDLPARMEGKLQGEGGRGALVLRRFKAGEVICRQGDAGFTAFYLIGNRDLIELRERHAEKADEADRELRTRAPELLLLSKGERTRRAEEIDRAGADPELAELLFVSANRPEAEELAELHRERALLEAGERADRALGVEHPGLLALDAAGKVARADEMESVAGDLELAELLRTSARAAERRVRAEVSVARGGDNGEGGSGGVVERIRGMLGIGRRPRGGIAATATGSGSGELVVGTLVEGELFGELSCLHHTPRSATVRALRDCCAIELLGHMLQLLLAGKKFRARLDATYRSRTLGQALRATHLFSDAPDEVIELVRQRAALVSRGPGEALFEERDEADALYVVRSGTLALVRRSDGDRVVGYRSRGDVIGESELARGELRAATCVAYEHPRDPARPERRLARVQAELIKIDGALWREACSRFPALLKRAARVEEQAAPETTSIAQAASRAGQLGLTQGRSLMLIDGERCTHCDDCVSACADSHSDGIPRLALTGPRVGNRFVPTSCRSCADAVCLAGCPVSAIHKGAVGQIVIEKWCIGCGLCSAQCPYGAIQLRAVSQSGRRASGEADAVATMAVTCDQCANLAGGPRCVSACAHDAVLRVDGRSWFAGAESGGQ